jgi:predicted patatin/cPLA2 family phospholipase
MGLALVQLGLTDVFDVVYGSSAGAFNGAYFVSRQGAFGITIYYEDINNERFINLYRPLIGRPVVSLDYIFDVVMTSSKPLDFEAIARSNIPLRVIAANITRRQAVVFDDFSSRKDLLWKLRASAAMPYLAGPPVEIDGELYSDASLYEPIPFKSAISASTCSKCTHVLALRSRPEGVTRDAPSFIQRKILGGSLRKYGAEIYDDFLNASMRYSDDLAVLADCTKDPNRVPYLYQVTVPMGTPAVSAFERRRDTLVEAAAAGMKAMVQALTGTEVHVMELITPLQQNGKPFTL